MDDAPITKLGMWMHATGHNDQTLAPKVGISRAQVSRIRRNIHRPRLKLARKIEEVTGIPAQELLVESGLTR